ncbi:hypothetical protein XAC3218_80001 [Xanthomonas citri pv. citri]|nr:hypothetical protein XAC908_100001 [Xanthomonas citri pv. citri]CEE45840.1 hypothetical protein XAC902_80001 [Xanthomonas citri pv. citri]CEE47081.1 hypothetical protein XAC2911_70001 [Xanthomonas citri pv. citri]CEE50167.1 hypothetical protein XAC71A_100001 [Xanthomonas citri pv. citri]CEE69959.1 hypothetical protein XACS584_70001 [Xanthomonas citri pv. citri]
MGIPKNLTPFPYRPTSDQRFATDAQRRIALEKLGMAIPRKF